MQPIFLLLLTIFSLPGLELSEATKDLSTLDFQGKCGAPEKLIERDKIIEKLKSEYPTNLEEKTLQYMGDFSKPVDQLVGAAVILKNVGTNKSLDKMITAMGILSTGYMDAATEFVAKNDNIGHAERLIALEGKEQNEDRKNQLDIAMCNISGKNQFKTVVSWATAIDPIVRRRGISSLKSYNNDESRKLIIKALFDENESVMYNAIISLGDVGNKEEMILLQYLLVKSSQLKGIDQIGMLSVIKDAGTKIKERTKIPAK